MSIHGNRNETHNLRRVVDDLFVLLQERLNSGLSGPAAFKMLLSDITDCFDHAPSGAALMTLQTFGVRTGTPFCCYL